MRTFQNSKYHHTICLKFGHLFFTYFTKLILETKASISFIIKENLVSVVVSFRFGMALVN